MNSFDRSYSQTICAFVLLLLAFSIQTWAQQPAPVRKRVPTLTSDDVRPPVEQPVEEPSKSGDSTAAAPGAKVPAKADQKVGPEEASWRERIAKARERAKSLERAADQAELRITQLRNDLGNSGEGAKYRNETAAALEEVGNQLSELRKQSREAAEDVAQLEEYGKEHKFAESEGPSPTTKEGTANEAYYRDKFEKLTDAVQDADRQAQVYENRVREISQHILLNGGKNGGDNFYILQLQQDRDEAQRKLDEAVAARAKARGDLEALMEEARRNAVPPGVFR